MTAIRKMDIMTAIGWLRIVNLCNSMPDSFTVISIKDKARQNYNYIINNR